MRGQLLDIRGLSRPVLDAWRQLASAAVEPNPFFGPEMAMAAARHLPGGEGDRLLAVFDGEAMVLALPVRRVRAYRQVPLPTVLAWGHAHAYLDTPLVAAADPVGALACALDTAAAAGARWLVLARSPGDGPVRAALDAVLDARGVEATALLGHERHRADLPLLMPGGAEDLEGRPSETVRDIESNGSWMVLWNVERDSAWRQLLHDCLGAVDARVPEADRGMLQRQGFLFLSAPDAVTPAHFDPENTLLLRIRGSKEMSVGRFADPVDQQRELDRYHDGGHRNIEQIPVDVRPCALEPGDGVYVLPFAPHWVRNGDAVSISLSITFRTRRSLATERAHQLNARLRRLGRHPLPAGIDERRDRAKATVMRGAEQLIALRRAPGARRG